MTEVEIVTAIRKNHLKANIDFFEKHRKFKIHWDLASVDPGGTTLFGPGPYLKVPVTYRWLATNEELFVRVYPPARLRRRLRKALNMDIPEYA